MVIRCFIDVVPIYYGNEILNYGDVQPDVMGMQMMIEKALRRQLLYYLIERGRKQIELQNKGKGGEENNIS